MCANVGLYNIAYASHYTNTDLTHKFLASFYDDYKEKGNACTVSFTINQRPYKITFQQFCEAFGFPQEGVSTFTNSYSISSWETWEVISVNSGRDFYQKKMSTIQNPTIRCFALFIANTLLGRGDTGSMANADMAMITTLP